MLKEGHLRKNRNRNQGHIPEKSKLHRRESEDVTVTYDEIYGNKTHLSKELRAANTLKLYEMSMHCHANHDKTISSLDMIITNTQIL